MVGLSAKILIWPCTAITFNWVEAWFPKLLYPSFVAFQSSKIAKLLEVLERLALCSFPWIWWNVMSTFIFSIATLLWAGFDFFLINLCFVIEQLCSYWRADSYLVTGNVYRVGLMNHGSCILSGFSRQFEPETESLIVRVSLNSRHGLKLFIVFSLKVIRHLLMHDNPIVVYS